jgi:hypothetical protein
MGIVVICAATYPVRCLKAGRPPRMSQKPSALAAYDALITAGDREHWGFQPVAAPSAPKVKDGAWIRNAIDRFILAKLEAQGWSPAPAALPRALCRRLFLDVTGLPPTPHEQSAFIESLAQSQGAVERLVDRLLASPAYGERWARHWLDLVRYAETNGYERDATKPFAWRYRDYVIRAFNDDKPFDRFAIEQLAGDELPESESSAETLVATGYYRLGAWDDEPADPKQDRYDQLDDLVTTTSEVFLGLTLGCARCHNHKFEPLTMHDYYRMVAIFQPLERPVDGRAELTLPIGTKAQLETARSQGRQAKMPQGYFLHERSSTAPSSHLLLRGQAASPGPEVGPGVPAVIVKAQPAFLGPSGGATSSQRRLTLARWLARRDNPLTARVIVNRVWQYHFGAGLVRTASDFGTMGEPPTHPELLDWIARWFVDHGWSLKALHRLILCSNTYRMSTQANARYAAVDPENRQLWRMPYRRTEVEVILDAMLAASGELNRQMYGESMFPFIPGAALAGHSDPKSVWKPYDERSASRRTVYAFLKRSLIVPMLEVLDLCDTARSTARRSVTSVPTQALTLLNGAFVNQQAQRLADRLERDAGPDRKAQIERAYLLTVCRVPRAAESDAMRHFLERETREISAEPGRGGAPMAPAEARHRALLQLCRAIFNMNEFVYVD